MKFKDQFELWEYGYVIRNSNFMDDGTMLNGEKVTMKEMFDSYEYSVEIIIDHTSTIEGMRAAEAFCKENFGELNEYDPKCMWQVCSVEEIIPDPPGPSRQFCKLIFLFHNADDAMAFKLRWQ